MTYNDGHIHEDFYEDSENLEKIASEFSEGNPLLASTLLTLWKNGIKTHGCCNGHEDNPISYLSIEIDKNSRFLINNICNNLEGFEDVSVNFTCSPNMTDAFSIDMPIEVRDIVLNFILNNIKKVVGIERNNRVLYSEFLIDFAHRKSLSLRYAFASDGKQALAFSLPEVLPLFTSNIRPLEDAIECLKQTNGFATIPYSCTDESLEEFISLIYKSAFFDRNIQSIK